VVAHKELDVIGLALAGLDMPFGRGEWVLRIFVCRTL